MTTKTVWQTDRNGFLLGETIADESPLEPGVWLVPAGCVEVEPPADKPDGRVPRWNPQSGKWQRVRPQEPAEPALTPQEKLAAFLAANPDVQAMIDPQVSADG